MIRNNYRVNTFKVANSFTLHILDFKHILLETNYFNILCMHISGFCLILVRWLKVRSCILHSTAALVNTVVKSVINYQITRIQGIKKLSDLGDCDASLILRRSGYVALSVDATVCSHHEQLFLHKYSFLQKTCCDPYHR
jgi:hypothetical protein